MFEGANSALLKLKISFEKLVLVMADMAPLLTLPFVWLVLVVVFQAIVGEKKSNKSEILFFALIGSVGAYLNAVSEGTLLENALPSFVVVTTLLFQLLATARPNSNRPIVSEELFLAGSGTALCYIICSRYVSVMFE